MRKASPPPPGEGKRGAQGHIGYLLRQAAAAHALRLERLLADLGATPPQFVVLTMLAAYPGLSNADLARLALLTPQTVSVIVANLMRSGAIARRPHAAHGRIRQIELTRHGRALLAKCRRRVAGAERLILDGLTPKRERIVREWLVAAALANPPAP